ncbi:sodium/hydrogen exchanger [Xylanimonas cellulosilytica DSM 15894]|uniref:Sodium/hydrogen exchanger n=1 Tax=Xylanimonas cellulosilytica (strain DSM 15894 / JCM 12276 / CECT 5975 / KCTC 9989 / LMG 20990 / NBRC 107835 / XIL07) TaxID=446471 RepID=D1BYC3_XYLCX|nr:cation:proton antiporter [Xylanimonas cellulosilytica]ACZ31795.1 sodium/hydrogen exchanger [Xylanimonas cellulosilytica DSM 15894]
MDPLLVAVLAVVTIIAVMALAPRTGVSAPLILVLVGVGISLLPFVPAIELEPEWILAGVLPPLLYSAAVSLPTMDFKRDLATIGGLSVALVVVTSVLLGFVFQALLPGLGLAGGIALGAILSPTDAVATSIVKKLGAPPRVVTVLEGEGLLNDASALVLLRSAVAATAASVSFGEVVGDFAWAVAGAVLCGAVVGRLGLEARRRIGSAALSTALSFAVPFAAFIPAEHLGASGLVAVVTAGLVTGYGAAKYLGPQDRQFESSNWQTVEILLEGAVFLLVGLELFAIVEDVRADHGSLWLGAGLAALGAVVVLVVRAAYVAPLLRSLARKARRAQAARGLLAQATERIDAHLVDTEPDGVVTFGRGGAPFARPGEEDAERPRGFPPLTRDVPVARVQRMRTSLVRRVADIDYLAAKPLGPREGVLLVWAGMRGVVTVAAAQSLPQDFPHRSFVLLVAFGVATGTLLVQGGTLPWVVRRLGLAGQGGVSLEEVLELRRVVEAAGRELLDDEALTRPDGTPYDGDTMRRVRSDVVREQASDVVDVQETAARTKAYKELRLRVIEAQRTRLLAARADGVYDSHQLERALAVLDAEQIMVEMKKRG